MSAPLFREAQAFRQWRTRLLLAVPPTGVLLLAIWQIGLGHAWGVHPIPNDRLATLLIFLWLVYVWLLRVHLVTTVENAEINVRLTGLRRHSCIALQNVTHASETTFDPVHDFGGYGFRTTPQGPAYVAGGTHGIQLDLKNGQTVVIGSARPSDLLRAIERARASRG